MKIGTLPLAKLRAIWSINATLNKAGATTHFVNLQVHCGPKTEIMKFLITYLGEDEIVLGFPWLAAFQPKINWKEAVLEENLQPVVIKTLNLKNDREVAKIHKAWTTMAQELARPEEEIYLYRVEEEKLKWTSTFMQMAIKVLPKEEKTWDQIVPPQYHHC